jgi:hypothetical protein
MIKPSIRSIIKKTNEILPTIRIDFSDIDRSTYKNNIKFNQVINVQIIKVQSIHRLELKKNKIL